MEDYDDHINMNINNSNNKNDIQYNDIADC